METKQKTLAECRDIVAIEFSKKHGYTHCRTWEDLSDLLGGLHDGLHEQAAELYASEENRKKDEPKQSDVDFESIADEIDDKLIRYSTEESDNHLHWRRGVIDALKWQSQQPASVAFFSDQEIQKKCFDLVDYSRQVAVFGKEKAENVLQMSVLAMQHIQSDLRKRVIDPVLYNQWVIDNYSRAIGGLGSGKFFKKYISGTDEDDPVYDEYYTGEELLQIYINSKT